MECAACHTEVRGEFAQGRFARLDDEQLELLIAFLRQRGNVKALCADVGQSHPTVSKRLERVFDTLDL
jgi:hypothetical protein